MNNAKINSHQCINIITSLTYPSSMREVCSFFGHASFYQRFIKDFSQIARPLFNLFQKDVLFDDN